MSRLFITLACIAFVVVCSAQNLEQHVQFVDDIEQFRAENPDVQLTPMVVESVKPFTQIRHTMGRRVLGDIILSQGYDSLNYPGPQDVRRNLSYPARVGLTSYLEELARGTFPSLLKPYAPHASLAEQPSTATKRGNSPN